MSHHTLTIRATTRSDHDRLASLTTRRSAHGPGPSLVADLDGTPVAAISLTTGSIAADPKQAHPEVVRSLRYRRYQILRQGGEGAALLKGSGVTVILGSPALI